MATGSYSADEVRRWLNGKGVAISKQIFLNTISAQTLNLYRKILEKMFDEEDVVRRDEITQTENEIDKIIK